MSKHETSPIVSLCSSFGELAELEAISVVDGDASIQAILRNTENGAIDARARAALIEASRAGKHVELSARAITFRQKDGNPNKNYLRFKSSKLEAIGASFVKRPFLLDHNTWSQSSRMGTILESEAVPLAGGWVGFRQQLHAVKPHGVQSILDGTLDQFSIGWDPRGQVMCTAHGVDVRSRKSCYWTEGCYPGKLVEVDGVTKIAEYEWQDTTGTETSGVNSPAVSGTKIEDVKTALAAELSLTPPTDNRKDPDDMNLLASLATILGVATLTEADASSRVKELADGKLAAEQERDTALARSKELDTKVAELEAKVAEIEGGRVDTILAAAYDAGKLIRSKDKDGKDQPSPREARLRRIAKEPNGIASLEAELAEMPAIIPIKRSELREEDPNPRPSHGPISRSVLESTARQMGLSVEELEEHQTMLAGGAGTKGN